MEAGWGRESAGDDTGPINGNDWLAVLSAFDDEPAAAIVVLASEQRRGAVSIIRAFELRLATRAVELSAVDRAESDNADAGLFVVWRIRLVHVALRRDGVVGT